VAALFVDSLATATVPLASAAGRVLAPGQYVMEGEIAALGPGGLLRVSVERLPVDTLPHAPDTLARQSLPETRRRILSPVTMGEGLGLGALALLASVVVNDRSVSGRQVPSGAWFIGGSVTLATYLFKRPAVPIPENIARNAMLRAQVGERNRVIAAANAAMLRSGLLRIRTTREP